MRIISFSLKKAMQKVILESRNVNLLLLELIIVVLLSLGFGYFFGRYDQIQRGRAVLETIPDVHCQSS